MAYLAMKGSAAANGVSALHGRVSRHLFQPLFPHWPEGEVPVGHITNGVHMPSWDSAAADELWTKACAKDRWLGTTETLEQNILSLSDAELWNFRQGARASLVDYARERLSTQLTASGSHAGAIDMAHRVFDPNTLTLGFARRFAAYKRPNLLLHDRERLVRIITNPDRPVQLIIAGKAHPEDKSGQALIYEWINFIRQPEIRPHIVFLSDYDMLLTERLVQGVDVWINTPRRPWEACGTSGMKVLVNGGINLSELDGWWSEAFSPDVGWALGDGKEHGDDAAWDAHEAEQLYDLLEREVVAEFYDRGEGGIPAAWVKRMRTSMAQLTPRYSANRTVREYTDDRYIRAAEAYAARSADDGAMGRQLAAWTKTVNEKWASLHFGQVHVETRDDVHMFEVQLYLDGLDPAAVRVELYAESIDEHAPLRQEMTFIRRLEGEAGYSVFTGTVSAALPPEDYTARVIPHFDGVSIPMEIAHILWQH